MAITQSSLTAGASSTVGTSYVSASISPSANKLVLLVLDGNFALGQTTPPPVTVTGNGLTWQLVTAELFGSGPPHFNCIYLFRAMGSPSSGTVTFNFGAVTVDSCVWEIAEFGNVNISGTNGSGAIVQSAVNRILGSTTLSVTLSAFSDTNNATFGGFGVGYSGGVVTFTPGSGFTEIYDTGAGFASEETIWRADNSTTVDTTASASVNIGGVAAELRATAPVNVTSTSQSLALTEYKATVTITGKEEHFSGGWEHWEKYKKRQAELARKIRQTEEAIRVAKKQIVDDGNVQTEPRGQLDRRTLDLLDIRIKAQNDKLEALESRLASLLILAHLEKEEEEQKRQKVLYEQMIFRKRRNAAVLLLLESA